MIEREPNVKYIADISYGKDSLAMLEAIHRLGYPLDEIIHSEIWATDDIQADLPPMVKFKTHADKIIKEKYGFDVTKVCAMKNGEKWTYEKQFYTVRNNRTKSIYGFPLIRGSWCLSRLKLSPMEIGRKQRTVHYVGIAADETKRIARQEKRNTILPLVDIGWTEDDCMNWCRENNLVSPIYKSAARGGVLVLPQTKHFATAIVAAQLPRLMGTLA